MPPDEIIAARHTWEERGHAMRAVWADAPVPLSDARRLWLAHEYACVMAQTDAQDRETAERARTQASTLGWAATVLGWRFARDADGLWTIVEDR